MFIMKKGSIEALNTHSAANACVCVCMCFYILSRLELNAPYYSMWDKEKILWTDIYDRVTAGNKCILTLKKGCWAKSTSKFQYITHLKCHLLCFGYMIKINRGRLMPWIETQRVKGVKQPCAQRFTFVSSITLWFCSFFFLFNRCFEALFRL